MNWRDLLKRPEGADGRSALPGVGCGCIGSSALPRWEKKTKDGGEPPDNGEFTASAALDTAPIGMMWGSFREAESGWPMGQSKGLAWLIRKLTEISYFFDSSARRSFHSHPI